MELNPYKSIPPCPPSLIIPRSFPYHPLPSFPPSLLPKLYTAIRLSNSEALILGANQLTAWYKIVVSRACRVLLGIEPSTCRVRNKIFEGLLNVKPTNSAFLCLMLN